MTIRPRSPNYPNISLSDAIARVRRVFDQDRQNPLERSVVARHMGYSGISGASDKLIGSIMQFGLLERVAKGEIRVSQLAVDIFHPDRPDDRRRAIATAALMPPAFRALRERFGNQLPSTEALRSYLVRQNFLDRAIPPLVSAYSETCQLLEQENAFESGGDPMPAVPESPDPEEEDNPPNPPVKHREREKMAGERTLVKGMLSTEADFEVLVSGPVGVKEIERLIKKLEIDKEILAAGSTKTNEG
jgi:hypothetical protein